MPSTRLLLAAAVVAAVLVVLTVVSVSPQRSVLGQATPGQEVHVHGGEALRRKLQASVDHQRELGMRVKALVAASGMKSGRTTSLADDKTVKELQAIIESQSKVIDHLKKNEDGASADNKPIEADSKPITATPAEVDPKGEEKEEEEPPVPLTAADAVSAVLPVYDGGVRQATDERTPSGGSAGPDEGVWNGEDADADSEFDMGTNMAFLGGKEAKSIAQRSVAPKKAASAPSSPSAPAAKAAPVAAAAPKAAAAPVQDAPKGDARPPLDSFAMAKFANNVDYGMGGLGTNVAWMYNDLSKTGPYKEVENEDRGDDSIDAIQGGDSEVFPEYDASYKAQQRVQSLKGSTDKKLSKVLKGSTDKKPSKVPAKPTQQQLKKLPKSAQKMAMVQAVASDSDESNYHQEGPPMSMMKARTTQLALVSGWNQPFVDPYVPPKDLYLYWGSTSARGTVASQLTGGRGRASSGQRVRQVLHFGTFFGNHYGDDVTGHGHFLSSLEGEEFAALSRRCCATLLVPPMENDLPLYGEHDEIAQRIRTFVANGNNLVLTGGDYSSLVFLNKYFHYEIKKDVLDNGPFERLDEEHLPKDLQGQFKDVVQDLPQEGLSVTSVLKSSLPTGAKIVYATPMSTPVFQLTYCQAELDREACKIAKEEGKSCLNDAEQGQCPALKKKGQECSCGRILYLGYDFVGHHSSTIGTSVWDDTLKVAASVPKMGTPGHGVLP